MTLVQLSGDPERRGAAQADAVPGAVEDVRRAVEMRLGWARTAGHLGRVANAWLEEAHGICRTHVPEAIAEIGGIAVGYRLSAEALFAYLHLGVLGDLAAVVPPHADGCSAWAVASGPDGPLVVKNRDFRGEHLGLQRVFLHSDPAWAGNRLLCVGSLGSPGAYSSGMNAHGLALADTQVSTGDHRPGVLRYFVMTRILTECADVESALRLIAEIPHAGGGTLVMADRSSKIAAVELGASKVAVETGPAWVARTNHFISGELGKATLMQGGEPMALSSQPRLTALRNDVPNGDWSAQDALGLMATHGGDGGLCRHGEDGDARTISTAVFACATGTLYFANGYACTGERQRYTVAG